MEGVVPISSRFPLQTCPWMHHAHGDRQALSILLSVQYLYCRAIEGNLNLGKYIDISNLRMQVVHVSTSQC